MWWRNYDNTLSHFHTISERNGQTHRQTDRFAISILRVSMLTYDKNSFYVTLALDVAVVFSAHFKQNAQLTGRNFFNFIWRVYHFHQVVSQCVYAMHFKWDGSFSTSMGESSSLKLSKNYSNRSRFITLIIKGKLPCFYRPPCTQPIYTRMCTCL